MSVERLLVTGDMEAKMATWQATATVANWIEGRTSAGPTEAPTFQHPAGVETWMVTVFDVDYPAFLDVARAAGVTIQQIIGSDESERYTSVIDNGNQWPNPEPKTQDSDTRPDQGES